MATGLSSGALDKIQTAFASKTGRCGKLNDFILELQGSGNQTINEIVNDLVFLRRELMIPNPNDNAVQRVMGRLQRKTQSAAKMDSDYREALQRLQKTIARTK